MGWRDVLGKDDDGRVCVCMSSLGAGETDGRSVVLASRRVGLVGESDAVFFDSGHWCGCRYLLAVSINRELENESKMELKKRRAQTAPNIKAVSICGAGSIALQPYKWAGAGPQHNTAHTVLKYHRSKREAFSNVCNGTFFWKGQESSQFF